MVLYTFSWLSRAAPRENVDEDRYENTQGRKNIANGDGQDQNSSAGEESEGEGGWLAVWLDKTEKKVPRLFNLTTVVAIPLILMICLAMICGHFLAALERDSEMDSLHSSMVSFLSSRGQIRELVDSIEKTYEQCFDEYIKTHPKESANEAVSITKLKSFMDECRKEGMERVSAKVLELDDAAEDSLIDSLSLNWNKCFTVDEEGNKSKLNDQLETLKQNWLQDYDESYKEHNLIDADEDRAKEKAIENARRGINEICSVNSAGGAMFWFTIMTTIGYGNTAPMTRGGRALVYTVGFLSVIIFTALIGAAGYVFLTIADDFFEIYKLQKLTTGFPSVIFWFLNLIFWILILAGMFGAYEYAKYGEVANSVEDRIWWAYISVTTVGFGDYYIAHDTFQIVDVWYVPLLMLMGFVNLANFLIKLSELIIFFVKATGITDDESLNYLLKQSRLGIDILELDGKKFNRRDSYESENL